MLNSKYRISWEYAELLVGLADGCGGASTTENWGVGSAPPLEFSLPRPNEIMGGAGASDSGVGKKRSRERAMTLAGDEAKPTPFDVDVDSGCAFCVFEWYAYCCFGYQRLVARVDRPI